MPPVVGIDLGTTSSRVALVEDKTPVILENSEGEGTTPSFIAITSDGDRLVGEAARRYAVHDPKNVAFAVKRLIGRKYVDPIIREISQYVPYEIIEANNGDAWIRLSGQAFSPTQLSAFILQKMKQTAENYVREPVTQAVITVPAYFNDAQRQATKDAGRISGLEVLRIINEPTAAALAYGLDKKSTHSTIAVYDLGGGTFDISLLEIGDGVFEVKATRGDMHLGGEDIDYRIVKHLAEEFKKECAVDLLRNETARQRLKQAAEHAKIELSHREETAINLPFIHFDGQSPVHLRTTLKRPIFEKLIDDLIQRTIRVCASALQGAGEEGADLNKSTINQVVLVGGSTRIPCVQGALERFFDRRPYGGLRREDAVALGAAIQAGVLKGNVKDVLLLDVLPMSLGIETSGGAFTRLIDRNTTIPTKKGQTVTVVGKFPDSALLYVDEDSDADKKGQPGPSYRDTDGAVLIRVLQGDNVKAFENETLGRFVLNGIPSNPDSLPRILITFDIDANGILYVSAKDRLTAQENAIRVQASTSFNDRQIEAMAQDAKSRPVISKQIKRDLPLGVERPVVRRETAPEPPPVDVASLRVVPKQGPDARPGLFVSYAHEDMEWARSLERALAILTRQNRIDLFIDHHLRTGEEWKKRIFGAIEDASAAVLLFSNHFFSSDFIMSEELPVILAEHERRGLALIPIVIRPCPFELHDDVARFQTFNNPAAPLSSLEGWQVDGEFSKLAREVARASMTGAS